MILIEKNSSLEIGIINKILVVLIVFVMLFMSTSIFFKIDFLETGSQNYVLESKLDINTFEDISQELILIIDSQVKKLSKNGEVSSWNFNKESFLQEIFVANNPKANNVILPKQVETHIDVTYNQYEVKILKDNSKFYFKTEKEATEFEEEIKENVEITKMEVASLDKISSKEDIDKKISELKSENEIMVAKVTSRGSSNRSSTKGILPLTNYAYISSYFRSYNRKNHTGVDFAATKGTKILAYKSGKVIRASWNGNYGMCIEIQHSNGEKTRYAHCSGYNVKVGKTVSQGQVIGYVGSTGNSTGPHLHFEIIKNGTFVNPLNYI